MAAVVRSLISSASSSAIAPMIVNIALPIAVDESIASRRETNWTPRTQYSSSAFTRYFDASGKAVERDNRHDTEETAPCVIHEPLKFAGGPTC